MRVRCCVPYCTHTRGPRKGDTVPVSQWTDWICGKHWRAVSREKKQFRQKADRAFEKAKAIHHAAVEEGDDYAEANGGAVSQGIIDRVRASIAQWEKTGNRARRAWDRCKREAIEKGMGI